MAIELATQYLQYVDELFTTESKRDLITNQDFSWAGAHTIKIYRISTSNMNDYDRVGDGPNISRYGPIDRLGATTQEMTLRKDRSFTFAIDRLDEDETKRNLQAATALARQLREVVIPEVDSWTYAEMVGNAGQIATPEAITESNLYELIITGSNALDNAEVPETGRSIIITPDIYMLLKKDRNVILETDVGNELRLRGVIAILDGLNIIRVPANRLPADFGFMIAHPVATVNPIKLESYMIHENPPFINGSLVEGRLNYDAFVLDNKADALYYQAKS